MKTQPSPFPSDSQLLDAPEVGSLALLQAALTVARNSLFAHVSDISHPIDTLGPYMPKPQALLAGLILDRMDDLDGLVGGYRRLTEQASRPDLHDVCSADPF